MPRPHRQRRPVRLGVAVSVLVLAACTGDPDTPAPSPAGPVGSTAAALATFCSGALPGPAAVALLGPGRIRESGVPQVPRPRQLTSQCALRGAGTTLTLATSAAEVTGRVTLQGIANNNPATAVPIAPGATGLVDPGLAWLARPCAERSTLLVSLRLTGTGPAAPEQRRTLAELLLAAADRAATAAGCDRGSTPAPATLPAASVPAPIAGTVCGAPAAAVTAVTGPAPDWTVTPPYAAADAPARSCELAGPGGARIRFVVSRGLVAANAGTLPIGTGTPVAGLPGATAGPGGARLDTTCAGAPIAYRLRLTDLRADTGDVGTLFTALVRAVGCR